MVFLWNSEHAGLKPIVRKFLGHISGNFCAHFGQVLGRLAGAWYDTGRADDSVDSLMHGHTMWQSRHGWKREAAPFNRAPSPTPSRLQKLTTTKKGKTFSLRKLTGPGQTARQSGRGRVWMSLRGSILKNKKKVWADREATGCGFGIREPEGGSLQPLEVYALFDALKWWHQWWQMDLLFVFKYDISGLKVWRIHTAENICLCLKWK